MEDCRVLVDMENDKAKQPHAQDDLGPERPYPVMVPGALCLTPFSSRLPHGAPPHGYRG